MEFSTTIAGTQHNKNPHRGFSLIELLIVVAIILIIAAIAIPNMLKSRMAANQAAAVSNLRTLTTASASYSVSFGNGYPPNLTSLGGLGPGASCDSAVLLDNVVASAPNQKSGYQFAYAGQEGNVTVTPAGCSSPGFNGYLATAAPLTPGLTGNISYCSSEDGIIHYDVTGVVSGSQGACNALPTLQ